MRPPSYSRQASNRSHRYSIDDPETVLGHEPQNATQSSSVAKALSRPSSRNVGSIEKQQ